MLKKRLPWVVISLLLAVLSIWAVVSQSRTFSLHVLLRELQNINIGWLLLAIVSMMGFVVFEGLALDVLIRGLSGEKSPDGGIVYAAADVYFSAITPSASGGQPASAFFMIWDGIPAAHTTVILLVNLIMYTMSLFLCGVIAFVSRWWLLPQFDLLGMVLIGIGAVILLLLAALFYMLLRKAHRIKRIGFALIKLGEKLHVIHHPGKLKRKLIRTMIQYHECAEAIRGKRKVLGMAFLMNLLQRLSHSMVTVSCFLAMGGLLRNAFTTWCMCIVAAVGSNSIPIPGAMGVADYLLIKGLDCVEGIANPANLELVSRGLSFYICCIFSVIVMGAGYLLRRKKRQP